MYKQFTNKQIITLQTTTKCSLETVTCLVIRLVWLHTYLFHMKFVITKQFIIYIQFDTKFYVGKFQQMKQFDELKFSKMIVSFAHETC